MKYIGIDARFFSTNATGIGRYVYELIRNLLEILPKELKLVIFINKEYIDHELFINKKDKLVIVAHDYDHYSLRSQIFYHRILNSFEVDVLHVPHFNIPLFYKGKYILTVHDLIHHRYPPRRLYKRWKQIPYLFAAGKAIQNANHIISVSESTKKDILNYYPNYGSEKITTTLEGVPEEYFANKNSADKNYLNLYGLRKNEYVMYLGRHSEHKNVEVIIKSIKGTDLKAVIGGKNNWETNYLKKLVKTLNIKKQVIFPGFIKDEDAKTLFQNALCYIQPSFIEGFGLPPLEAMSQGCPVICSEIDCHREIAEDSALFFNPNKSDELKAKIHDLMNNEELRQNLINKGNEQVKKYSWKKMAIETLEIYKQYLFNIH